MPRFYSAIPLLAAAALLLATPVTRANNLNISGINLAVASPVAATATVRATVGWDNSWRDQLNWDAAWVFVKYRRPGGPWLPATLAPADADHAVPAGSALSAAPDGTGAMLYRGAIGAGTFAATVGLRWNLAADGITPGQNYEVRVFGVEMVRIPQGSFALNAAPQASLSNEFVSAGGSLAQVASEAALPAGAIRWVNESGGGGAGNPLVINNITYEGSDALGPDYPKGFAASYCMKYEISQGQYTDFLNCLTRAQQRSRVQVDVSADAPAGGNTFVMPLNPASPERSTITCPASGMGTTAPITFSCARPDRAGNQLVWADGAAYLDWAGLRPMTELEYEKICRGPEAVLPGGYAWGSGAIVAANTISGPEDGTETTDAAANAVFDNRPLTGGDGGLGPLRCGIFARAATTREQAGATFFGVMEMTANCWERCITVAAADGGLPTNAGRFDGRHGDGRLDAAGNQDVTNWPNSTDVLGSNFRGGNWSRPREWAAVSDRLYGGQAISGRTAHRSIRGLRSASALNPAVPVAGPGVSAPDKFYGGPRDGYAAASGTLVLGTRTAAALPAMAVLIPNPIAAGNGAVLRLSGRPLGGSGTLVLRDALGRTVLQIKHLRGLEVAVECPGLAPGLYTYSLLENGELVAPVGKFEVR